MNLIARNPENQPYCDELAGEIKSLHEKRTNIILFQLAGTLLIIGIELTFNSIIPYPWSYGWCLAILIFAGFCIAWGRSVGKISLEKSLLMIDIAFREEKINQLFTRT